MEAHRFGFDAPPAFKFDPTDDDIVAHYLLPRALGIPDPPFGHAVIEADPASLPPPDLLALHGHANSHQAFFVHTNENGGSRERVIRGGAGGIWLGQQDYRRTLTLLRPGPSGGELDIVYKRYDLTYRKLGEDEVGKTTERKQGGSPSGWVMHEYQIISPPLQTTVLSRIKRSDGKIGEDQQQAEEEDDQLNPAAVDQHHQGVPPPEQQAGPSC